ncbi:hypothetical protein MKX08_009171 [Trichoderma sp. CBMAI-0020]|nr:hypothetical protein MKX08_009171 [Trichoderma sp. CBMAI-0020]
MHAVQDPNLPICDAAGNTVYLHLIRHNHPLLIAVLILPRLPPHLRPRSGFCLDASLPGTRADDKMRLDEPAQVVVGAIFAPGAIVGLLAQGGVVARVLPGLSRQVVDDDVAWREDGGVCVCVGEGLARGLVHAREGEEGGEGALGAEDVVEQDGGLDLAVVVV